MVLAVFYALLAGLRTVGEFDLGWQLATGRYVIQQGQIPFGDVFSYTVRGNEWIYPPVSGIVFYALYLLGGYAALSWLSAAACGITVLLLLRGGGAMTAALAAAAVPVIAYRTAPRAELFTTLLFAAFLGILWQHFRGGRAPLALLPWLMLVWVNLHLGFIAGLAMLAGYVLLEILELPRVDGRAAARDRLRRASPWLLATLAATVVNPWGPRIYTGILRQNRSVQQFGDLIGEWSRTYVSSATLGTALTLRDPDSGYWWLLVAALAGVGIGVWRKQMGAAVLLAASAWLSLNHLRLQGLFACVVVVIAGALLSGHPAERDGTDSPADEPKASPGRGGLHRARSGPLAVLLVAAIACLLAVRVSDLVSNHYYLVSGQISLFGAGESWWYPERATAFLLHERLPGNVFNDYNSGGYLTWRVGTQYPDYVDGRAIPFGAEFLSRHRALMQQPPDSPEWQQEAAQRNINTVLVSVARYAGLGGFPLRAFCESRDWKPVYLDEVAAIFVRDRPENAAWIDRLRIDCSEVALRPPAGDVGGSFRSNAEQFNFLCNAAAVYYVLGRDAEALDALARAQAIFAEDSHLYLTRGQLFEAEKRLPEAEKEYQTSVRLRPTDAGWYSLARLYAVERRHGEAAEAIRASAQLSYHPYDRYRWLGQLYLAMQQPRDALAAFDQAAASSPYQGASSPRAGDFNARVAAGRARAWRMLGDLNQAVEMQQEAVRLSPLDPSRWAELADLYQQQGRSDLASQARQRAQQLSPQ